MGGGLRMMESKISNEKHIKVSDDPNENSDIESNKEGETNTSPSTIIFTHKIIPGLSPSSFGCSVAYSAGIPVEIVNEAQALTNEEENKELLSLVQEAEQLLKDKGTSLDNFK
eukprot:gnl/Chilomastix_caulleri/2438.p1 GENE.gnl/Chilomastix_caulleri/2438~~gnl/Chilomastix_caulleri/2438.p1  ORF type:complete len:113 (+),score=26.35 gnl/Chilomastix_caulleri/2438:107-445(+)